MNYTFLEELFEINKLQYTLDLNDLFGSVALLIYFSFKVVLNFCLFSKLVSGGFFSFYRLYTGSLTLIEDRYPLPGSGF